MGILDNISNIKNIETTKLKTIAEQYLGKAAALAAALLPIIPKLPTPSGIVLETPNLGSIASSMPALPAIPPITLPTIDVPSTPLPALPVIPAIPSVDDLAMMVPVSLPPVPAVPVIPMPVIPVPTIPPVESPSLAMTMPNALTNKTPLEEKGVNPKAQIKVQGEAERQRIVKEILLVLEEDYANIETGIGYATDLLNAVKTLADSSLHPTTESGWKTALDDINTKNNLIFANLKNRIKRLSTALTSCYDPNTISNELASNTPFEELTIAVILETEAKRLRSHKDNNEKTFDTDYWSSYGYTLQKYIGGIPNDAGTFSASYAIWKLYGKASDPTVNFGIFYGNMIRSVPQEFKDFPQYNFTCSSIIYPFKLMEVRLKRTIDILRKTLPVGN